MTTWEAKKTADAEAPARFDEDDVRRIHAVARRALRQPYFVWDWGEAVVVQALLLASEATGEPEYYRWVTSRLELWRQIHPEPFWPDHMGPGVALVRYFAHSGDEGVLDYAVRLVQHLSALPKARTGARLLRPDKPDLARFVWVDSLYTDGPFLCALGQLTGDSAFLDEGAEQTEGIGASLQDPGTGLFAHRYDDRRGTTNGVFWGRGCGWAALGLGHVLALLPRAHRLWDTLAERLRRLAATAASLQTPSGLWHTVIDRSESKLEASTTALIGEGIALGIAAGALEPGHTALVTSAWSAVQHKVSADGVVLNVSQRSPSSPRWEDYDRLPHSGCHAWGQGPWLQFACRTALGYGIEANHGRSGGSKSEGFESGGVGGAADR